LDAYLSQYLAEFADAEEGSFVFDFDFDSLVYTP
jgi:hypothetical protein